MSKFTINSSHQSFNDKQKCLFDQLEAVEKKNNPIQREEPEQMDTNETRVVKNNKNRRSPMKQYKSKESIFKKPEAPIFRCLPVRRLPEHQKHPQKWTKYSLDDVQEITERSNKQAAFSFLNELAQNKHDNYDEAKEELPNKIIFKKNKPLYNTTSITESSTDKDKPSFRSSKLIMPEYIVGKSGKKNNLRRPRQAGKSETVTTQLKLDHLNECEDEDDM